jgi:hypothetical protein
MGLIREAGREGTRRDSGRQTPSEAPATGGWQMAVRTVQRGLWRWAPGASVFGLPFSRVERPSVTHKLKLPFSLRGSTGNVAVTVESNPRVDPYEVLPGALAREGTRRFPVSTAQIEYPRQGYAAAFGWIQMVKASDGASTEDFGIDPIALCQNMQTPYGWFGIKPTLFDAPSRLKPDDMAWICQSYLCFTPNAVVGPHVRAVAGFEWGFVVQRDTVTVRKPSSLSEDAWNDRVPLLRNRYPGWTFDLGFRDE